MAEQQTQSPDILSEPSPTSQVSREFLDIPTAENSRLNKGFEEYIYLTKVETKIVIKRDK